MTTTGEHLRTGYSALLSFYLWLVAGSLQSRYHCIDSVASRYKLSTWAPATAEYCACTWAAPQRTARACKAYCSIAARGHTWLAGLVVPGAAQCCTAHPGIPSGRHHSCRPRLHSTCFGRYTVPADGVQVRGRANSALFAAAVLLALALGISPVPQWSRLLGACQQTPCR